MLSALPRQKQVSLGKESLHVLTMPLRTDRQRLAKTQVAFASHAPPASLVKGSRDIRDMCFL